MKARNIRETVSNKTKPAIRTFRFLSFLLFRRIVVIAIFVTFTFLAGSWRHPARKFDKEQRTKARDLIKLEKLLQRQDLDGRKHSGMKRHARDEGKGFIELFSSAREERKAAYATMQFPYVRSCLRRQKRKRCWKIKIQLAILGQTSRKRRQWRFVIKLLNLM